MLFGFDDSLKELKKELKNAGADMSVVKDWQKSFDKVKKQSPQLEVQYTKAKKDLEAVKVLLEQMEQMLIESRGSSIEVSKLAGELKKYQNGFNHEFLISKEDSDFHLTYKSILALSGKKPAEEKDALILQSEVENLLAVTKEALEKEWPSFRAMAYFYIDRTDKEIYDLPHIDKVEKVNRIYQNEFFKPMKKVMRNCNYTEEKINYILEEKIWI